MRVELKHILIYNDFRVNVRNRKTMVTYYYIFYAFL